MSGQKVYFLLSLKWDAHKFMLAYAMGSAEIRNLQIN